MGPRQEKVAVVMEAGWHVRLVAFRHGQATPA
jgi:hypothetical protein